MQPADQQALNEALSRLETALLTPVVSGELASWVHAVQQAAGEVGTQLKAYLNSTQRSQYRQIASSDPELLVKVQQLAREDQELLAEFAGLEKNLERLAQLVSAADKDESRAEKHRSELEQQGTATILRIRKQQVATDTWLSEAVYRDRGVAD
jgi:outer membrane murein-binding lipoprotein Lpp